MRQFCLVPSSWMINRSLLGCQVELNIAEGGLGSCRNTQKRRKSPRPARLLRVKILKNTHCRGLGGHQNFLISDLRRRRSRSDVHGHEGILALRPTVETGLVVGWFGGGRRAASGKGHNVPNSLGGRWQARLLPPIFFPLPYRIRLRRPQTGI
jgi:hypothetical protein